MSDKHELPCDGMMTLEPTFPGPETGTSVTITILILPLAAQSDASYKATKLRASRMVLHPHLLDPKLRGSSMAEQAMPCSESRLIESSPLPVRQLSRGRPLM